MTSQFTVPPAPDLIDISPLRLLTAAAAGRPNAPSIYYGAKILGIGEVLEKARRLAAGLRRSGVKPGDRVGLLSRNSPNFILCYLACAAVGAVFVPLFHRLCPAELAEIVDDCEPLVVIVEPDLVRSATDFALRYPDRTFIVVDDDPLAGPVTEVAAPWIRWTDFTSGPPAEPSPRGQDDPALLMYTSGTTGRPRGVVVTHGNLWWMWRNMDEICDTRLTDVTLVVAPQSHLGGLNGFALRGLSRGGALVITRSFDPGECLRLIEQYRVNTLFAVPSMLEDMARQPGFATADLSSMHVIMVGGATVPAPLLVQYTSRGLTMLHAWGMTETAGACLFLPSECTATRPDSVGVPVPYTNIKLVDVASGAEVVEADTIGELMVSGPTVTPGYWHNPAATAADIVNGWLRTGDLAQRDASGFYALAGRAKDMIISGGENIYPAEVEAAIVGLPQVEDAVVVGVPDATWGETPFAFVTLHPGTRLTLEELRAQCSGKLARYKLPRHMNVLEALPLGPSGKPDRKKLRAQAPELVDRSATLSCAQVSLLTPRVPVAVQEAMGDDRDAAHGHHHEALGRVDQRSPAPSARTDTSAEPMETLTLELGELQLRTTAGLI